MAGRAQEETPQSRFAAVTRRAALTGGAAAIASTAIAACGGDGNKPASSKAQGGTAASGIFKSSGKLKFVFVNHVTTNPFFVPTRYGAEDACKLLGCGYQWTGSENSNVNEMVNAFNTAVTGGADGIAVCLIDKKAFNQPVDAALKAKIPVVAYNADEHEQRAAGLHRPGPVRLRRRRWASGSTSSSPPATSRCSSPRPGSANIQPRIDGAQSALKKDVGRSRRT